jgi:hypothetical protein
MRTVCGVRKRKAGLRSEEAGWQTNPFKNVGSLLVSKLTETRSSLPEVFTGMLAMRVTMTVDQLEGRASEGGDG